MGTVVKTARRKVLVFKQEQVGPEEVKDGVLVFALASVFLALLNLSSLAPPPQPFLPIWEWDPCGLQSRASPPCAYQIFSSIHSFSCHPHRSTFFYPTPIISPQFSTIMANRELFTKMSTPGYPFHHSSFGNDLRGPQNEQTQ